MSHKEKVLNYMFNRIERIFLRTDAVMFGSAEKQAELLECVNSAFLLFSGKTIFGLKKGRKNRLPV